MNDALFSPSENKLLALLARKRVTIAKLTELYFQDEQLPLNPNNIVSGIVLNINKKCAFHKLKWKINGQGLGRAGKTVWKD